MRKARDINQWSVHQCEEMDCNIVYWGMPHASKVWWDAKLGWQSSDKFTSYRFTRHALRQNVKLQNLLLQISLIWSKMYHNNHCFTMSYSSIECNWKVFILYFITSCCSCLRMNGWSSTWLQSVKRSVFFMDLVNWWVYVIEFQLVKMHKLLQHGKVVA